jgi:2-keto-4-pentenoate hydratase
MDMNDLAERLWQARMQGGVVDPATIAEPASMDDAYAVQDDVIRLLGHPVAGFKVGSTSKEAQRILGTTEPGSCPVLVPYRHASPARVPVAPAHAPAIEGEFAFRLGRDLPPRDAPYSRAEVAGAVDAVAGAIEVVGTRLAGGLAGKGRFLVTADCGANIALVVGKWTTDWKTLDLPAHRVAVSINGRPAGEGTGARALDDPMNVMVWLANDRSTRGRGLTKGLCVSTGTCTGLDPVRPGDHVVADFGSLGTVEIDFA